MGSNSSKPNAEAAVHVQKNDVDFGDSSDPRSPTPEIVRTPLQGKCGSKHNITKNVDLRKTFENAKGEEKLIHNNPILSAVIKNHLQSYDPRSPSQDFERTPIVISSQINEDDKQLLRNQNELNCAIPCLRDDSEINDYSIDAVPSPELVVPKNLCDGFFDMTLNETIKDTEEPLGSSTASNEVIQVNISSNGDGPTQLLETNFDYVETESDKFEDSEENVTQKEELNYSIDEFKGILQFKILDVDPRSPSVGIERTPIVVSKINLEESAEENVEEMSDDTLIKVLQNTNAELRQNIAKPEDKNSEGLLIYEDESLNNTPKKSQSIGNSGCRTPLSCMKNKTDMSHTRSKSANTLFDPKNQKLGTKRTSHIPRLKSLSKQTKLLTTGSTVSLKNLSRASAISGNCENTPPHSHRDRWDKDNSIVL